MSAVMSRPDADFCTFTDDRSVDELDAAIGRLVRQMNADSYRMLVLVREFDDRFGWKKWTFKCCAEWLAWRSSISLSAAREKVRTAHALRALPAIAAAFAEGRLSYSKVQRTDTRRARVRRGLAARACARRDGLAGRGTLPADSQRYARLDSSRAARMGVPVADGLARRSARHTAAHRRAADRGGRADRPCARLRGGRGRGDDRCLARCRRRNEGHGLARAAGRRTRCRGEVVSRRRRS